PLDLVGTGRQDAAATPATATPPATTSTTPAATPAPQLIQEGIDDVVDIAQGTAAIDPRIADQEVEENRPRVLEQRLIGPTGTEGLEELPQGGLDQAADRAAPGSVEDALEIGGLARGDRLGDHALSQGYGRVLGRRGRAGGGRRGRAGDGQGEG